MINTHLVSIGFNEIDDADRTYYIPSFRSMTPLLTSIEQIGLLNPLILQPKTAGQFRIVCGFQRVRALRELGMTTKLGAFVFNSVEPSTDIFLHALLDNLSHRNFNPVELSYILQRLQKFGLNQEQITAEFLPKLGFGRNPKIIDLYEGIVHLSPDWQKAIIDDRVPLDLLQTIRALDESDSAVLIKIFDTLRLGKNRQREFLQLLADVARMQHLTIAQLTAEQWFAQILFEESWTFSQKAEHLKSLLWGIRYPRYIAVTNQFQALVKASQMPPGFDLHHSPYFETNDFNLNIRFSSLSELEQKLAHLEMMIKNGHIQRMIDLV